MFTLLLDALLLSSRFVFLCRRISVLVPNNILPHSTPKRNTAYLIFCVLWLKNTNTIVNIYFSIHVVSHFPLCFVMHISGLLGAYCLLMDGSGSEIAFSKLQIFLNCLKWCIGKGHCQNKATVRKHENTICK